MDYSRYDNNGPNATEVPSDISASNLHELMVTYYSANVKLTEAAAQKININTMDQGDSHIWLEERRKRITSSNVGQIAKRKSSTKVNATVRKLLYSRFRGKQGN